MSTPQHSTRKHSLLAPSKASTWSVCTASVHYCEANKHRLPPEQSSKWADEGTKAHEVADCIMRGQRVPSWATTEMIDHANAYRRYCASLHPKGFVDADGVEKEVPLFYRSQDNGHVDYLLDLIGGHRQIHVVDYKFGAGVHVDAHENAQMASYMASAIRDLSYEPSRHIMCHMHIFQPRNKDAQEMGKASTWSITWGELETWADGNIGSAASDIQESRQDRLVFRPGEKTCRWCPAKGFCTARAEQLVTGDEVIRPLIEAVDRPAPATMSDQDVARIVAKAGDIHKWLDDVVGYAFDRALGGTPISGTKVVSGRGTRTWSNESALLEFWDQHLTDLPSPFKSELKSPFQLVSELEEMGASKRTLDFVKSLITKNPGKPKLVPTSDPRPQYQDVKEEFSDIGYGVGDLV